MSGTWKWFTAPMTYKDVCESCRKQLRLAQDGVVTWCDGKPYHQGCLLDKLATEWKEPVAVLCDWGGVYPP